METVDQSQVEVFAGKALGDIAGLMTTLFCIVGDRLGLFGALCDGGPATSEELASRAGVNERYAREWLRGLTAAGYLEHDRATGKFSIPAAHLPVLAEEGGPWFFGGVYQETFGALPVLGRVIDVFGTGGGVDQSEYTQDFWAGMERFTSGWFDHLLVPVWLPALPDVVRRLEQGATWPTWDAAPGSTSFARSPSNSSPHRLLAIRGLAALPAGQDHRRDPRPRRRDRPRGSVRGQVLLRPRAANACSSRRAFPCGWSDALTAPCRGQPETRSVRSR